MSIKIKMTKNEADLIYRLLKTAEKDAQYAWTNKPSVSNRLKFETIESARLRFAQQVPA